MRRRILSYGCSRRCACCPASRRPRKRCCASFSPGSPSSTTSSIPRSWCSSRSACACVFICPRSSDAETSSYIDHRLEVAGSQGRRIFAEDTYPTIFKYTGGVPRLVNTLCDTAMMAAFGRDSDIVAMEDIDRPHSASCNGSSSPPAPTACSSCPRTATAAHAAHRRPDRRSAGFCSRAAARPCSSASCRPGRLVIGRTPDNDLQIDSKFISRHHCQIVTQADSCVIEDLNSTNGIYVQSKRVRRHNLNDGDVVVGRPARDHVHRRAHAALARHGRPARGRPGRADGKRRCAPSAGRRRRAQPPSVEG